MPPTPNKTEDAHLKTLIEAHQASLEQLGQRLIDAMSASSEAMSASRWSSSHHAPAADDQITQEQRLRQRQLILSYNAFRTMLGRAPTSGAPGAAVVFMAVRVNRKGQPDPRGDSIKIPGPAPFASLEDGWTLVAITTTDQTLRAALHRDDLPSTVQVEHLRAESDIGRLEIRNENDDPIYLGVGSATQTHNVERHRRSARELDREIR